MTYTIRDLPLPVKVVVTVFLLAVGVGYTSAMVQLHIQDSKTGSPMPTPDDVILKFAGKKKYDPNNPPPKPMSRLEALITGDTVPISGSSMTAAFTTADRAKKPLKFSDATQGQLPEEVEKVKAERKGEQAVFALWINTPDAARKAAYDADTFTPPAGTMPKAFTPLLAAGNAVKIKSLIDARCVTCHSKGGEKEEVALDTYDGLAKFMAVAPAAAPVHGYIKVEEPISVTKLTQSTHAHLLSFATLFSLTGLIFACSSWPAWMRTVVGPWVVVAIFADVSLWWLARLCEEYGPFFAQGIIVTGFLAGVGLFTQISGSLFTMYGLRGRLVVGTLMLLGAVAGFWFVWTLLVPALPNRKPAVEVKAPVPADKKKPPPAANPGTGAADSIAAAGSAVGGAVAGVKPAAPHKPLHALDKLLTWPPVLMNGEPIPPKEVEFNGGEKGSMVPAFFEKDKTFRKMMEGDISQDEKDRVRAQREGDHAAMLAWARTADGPRKAAYAADAFALPGAAGKPVTPDFMKDGKVRIKTLIDNRCATCHGPDGKQSDYSLDTYKGLAQYLTSLATPK